MGWARKLWERFWPAGALALLCVAFYWDVLWSPADRAIAGNDLTAMFYQWLRFAVSSIRAGQLPLWNPYLFAGIPFVANPQPALFRGKEISGERFVRSENHIEQPIRDIDIVVFLGPKGGIDRQAIVVY